MSCYLTFIGKDFDVDSFVERVGIKDFEKRYKGELVSVRRNKFSEYSSASIRIGKQELDNFNLQVREAEEFLINCEGKLKVIAEAKDIEYATISFGINDTVLSEKMNQSFYFPISFISICAELKISIETTIYSI